VLASPGGSQIPADIPWVQTGDIQIEVTEPITYTGDWLTYPTIIIDGPGDNTVIENVTTNETLSFTNTLLVNQVRTIDLSYGQKTVLAEGGVNKISELSEASDLATFHIAPDPEAPDGVNVFRISMPSRAGNSSRIRLQYYNRYLSL
jgi:hypothetical protein